MTIELGEDGQVHTVQRQISAKKPAAAAAQPAPKLVANAS